jgi:hypothetical protein
MRLVGQAFRDSDAVPLIGVGTWGVVQQKEVLENSKLKEAKDDLAKPKPYKESKGAGGVPPQKDHKNFIFVDSGKAEFGGEAEWLAALIKEIRLNGGFWEKENQYLKYTDDHVGMWKKQANRDPHTGRARMRDPSKHFEQWPVHNYPEIPVVCVCFEGGPGTLTTLHLALQDKTSLVIVDDSGRCSNVVSESYRYFHRASGLVSASCV